MSYTIIGDSCTDLPEKLKNDGHFYLVPLSIHIDDYTVIDDASFDQKDFLNRVEACPNCPKTSCPSPEAYMEHYGREGDIYVVTLSANLSGSYNSAELAKKLYLEEHPDKNIAVVNSCSASVGQTLIAMKIQEAAEQGKPFKEIVKEAEAFRDGLHTKFVLESLETLRKNGRLSNLKAIICSALNIKPVMRGTSDGQIEKMDQARGIEKALQKMADHIGEDVKDPNKRICAIAHCNNYERAVYVQKEISKRTSFRDYLIVDTAGISSFYASDGGIIVCY